jgi:fructokinase
MTAGQRGQAIPTVLCLGEVLIDLIAETPGSLTTASRFLKCAGGAPANVAVGIARLGVSCGFTGKVAADPFGDFLVSTLHANGVDTRRVVRTREAPTALAFVSRSAGGERDFLFYRNPCADAQLTEEDLPLDWLQQVRFLHIGGVSLSRDPSRQATLRAIKHAKANRAVVTFDPNLRLDLWRDDLAECRRLVRRALGFTEIFLPSEEELLLLMDTENLEQAISQVLALGPRVVCVKQGARGALIVTKSASNKPEGFRQPAFAVPVVDTTGAGDGFNAGLIAGLVTGMTLAEAARQGTGVAGLVITKKGAMSALPTRRQLTHFLTQAKVKKD